MNTVVKMNTENTTDMEVVSVEIDRIQNNPKNRSLDNDTVNSIASSFGFTGGLLQAIEVSPVGDGTYMVTDGHHRFAACVQAGLESVPCRVVEGLSDEDRFLRALIPNIHRREMAYSEKIRVMAHLNDGGDNVDPREVARKLGVRPASAAEMVFVAELPQELVEKADTNAAYRARFHKFARLPKSNRDIITENIAKLYEGMGKWVTPEQFDIALSKLTLSIEHACFDTSDCMRCPRNTNCQTGLFADAGDAENGTCTDAKCYKVKEIEAIDRASAREAERFNVQVENITSYNGDLNVAVDTVPVEFNGGVVNARPWRAAELNENAEGCDGCPCRIVVTQKMPGRVASVCACSKGSCYDNLMPKGKVETAARTDAGTDAEASECATEQANKGKSSNKVKSAFDGKLTSKCVVDYRRKMINTHIIKSVDQADPLARMKAAVLIMSASSIEVQGLNGTTLEQVMGTENPQEVAGALVQIIKDSVATLQAPNLKKLYALVTDDEKFKAAWNHRDASFLSGLNRAELLALLDRAGASSDEDFWKEAKKAKKGNAESGLVQMVLNRDLGGFVPEEVMIDKV